MRARGYVEGQNLSIEYRWGEGTLDNVPDAAAELVRLKVDAILAWGTLPVRAARQATSTVPIVMVGVGDPIGSGFVTSLARPGGNITGVSNLVRDVTGKRVELLAQALPGVSRLAVFRNPANPFSALQLKEAEATARALSLSLHLIDVRTSGDLESAFAQTARERIAGVVLLAEPMFFAQSRHIAELAIKRRVASMAPAAELVDAGGLMSYGASHREVFRQAANYVVRILNGAKPADLPVEQPTKLELVINLRGSSGFSVGSRVV
jgi:putative ABC transport system substrate-binding protein